MTNDNVNVRYLPVGTLTTFLSHWIIKTRVISKSEKSFIKSGQSLFYADLVDENGDIIRAKFWSESAEKWYPFLQEGKVYTFSKGRISLANKRFSKIPHNYELTFDANSDINITEDEGIINTQKSYSFMCLRDLKNSNCELPFIIDLLVFITKIGPLTQVSRRSTNDKISRRTITVADSSEYTFDITLWNLIADKEENIKINEACVISNVQVKEWNNTRVGQTTKHSEINFYYKSKKTDELNEWIFKNGKSTNFKTMRQQSTNNYFEEYKEKYKFIKISEFKKQIEDNPQQERLSTILGRIRRVYYKNKDGLLRISYPGCLKCKKKLIENSQGFTCIACNEDVHQALHRYMFSFTICDFSEQLTVRVFHDQGIQLLKNEPEEMIQMKESKVEELFEWDLLYNELQVILKSRTNNFSGENRMNHIAMRIEQINYQSAAVELLYKIKQTVPNAVNFVRNNKVKHDEIMKEDKNENKYNPKKKL